MNRIIQLHLFNPLPIILYIDALYVFSFRFW